MSETRKASTSSMSNENYDYDVLKSDRRILDYYHTALSVDALSADDRTQLEMHFNELVTQEKENKKLLLRYKDIAFLHSCLNKGYYKGDESSKVYLHQLMMLTVIELPSPPPIQRSAELEARLERLRLLAAEADYQKMTKNVSSTQAIEKENVGQELRKMDSQVTFLVNFVLTVVGAFIFGYKVVEYSLQTPNVSIQLTAGVTLATIVFFADIYFIIKEYV